MLKKKVLIFAITISLIVHFIAFGGWRYFFGVIPKKINYIEFLLMHYRKAPLFDKNKGHGGSTGSVRIPSTRVTPPKVAPVPFGKPLGGSVRVLPKPKIEVRPVKEVRKKTGTETEIEWVEVSESELRTANVVISYKKLLQELIIQFLEYPKEERDKGITGEVVVSFVVYRNGKLKKVSIPKKHISPVKAFNNASISAVKKASHFFPPFPSSCKEQEIVFLVKIHFE